MVALHDVGMPETQQHVIWLSSCGRLQYFDGNALYRLIDLKSVRGLAKTHQTGLGFVHAHYSDPSKEFGQPVALWLVDGM